MQVTPELIDIRSASRVWSQSYERVLEDIFSVQNEIAVHVIDQLNVTLFPSQRQALEANPTQSMEAYQSYLKGQELSLQTDSLETQESAVEWLERAVELDPNFVEGWSQLAWTHAQIYHFGLDRTDSRRQSAREAIRRALALDTTSPEARLAKANVLYWTEKDYRGALRELALARRRAPNDSRIIEAEGFILRRLGHLPDALEKIIDRQFEGTGSHINTMHKDLTISMGLGEDLGVPLHTAAAAMQIFHAGKTKFPNGDNWICTRVIEDIVGAELHRDAAKPKQGE